MANMNRRDNDRRETGRPSRSNFNRDGASRDGSRDGSSRPRTGRPSGGRPSSGRPGAGRTAGGRSFGDRPSRGFGEGRSGERSFGERSFGDRKFGGERKFGGDRKFGEKKFGDRPPRRDGEDRPPRKFGERGERSGPPRERSFDRDAKPFRGGPRSGGRSFGEKSFGDRPSGGRSFGGKSFGRSGDRPSRGFDRGPRKFGDRPERPAFKRPESSEESGPPVLRLAKDRSPEELAAAAAFTQTEERAPREHTPRERAPREEREPRERKPREDRGDRPFRERAPRGDRAPREGYASRDRAPREDRGDRAPRDRAPRGEGRSETRSSEGRGFDRKPRRSDDRFGDRPRKAAGASRGTGVKRKVVFNEKSDVVSSENAILEAMRLNRFIASSGITSRRKADELITQGKVRVNGELVTELGTQVKPYEDQITVDGETISLRTRFTYLLLNKPKDTITTTSDEKDRKTVMDLIKTHERVYPVGRLDRNTTGVLLLTNDGELTNRLTHPSYEIEREYQAILDKPLDRQDAKQISEGGIDIGDGEITGAAQLDVSVKDAKDVVIRLKEGKNREVRRIFEKFGYEVEKLDRVTFAGLTHRGMARGDVRTLTPSEVRRLKKMVGMDAEDKF